MHDTLHATLVIQRALELLLLSHALARRFARTDNVGSMFVSQVPALNCDQVPAVQERTRAAFVDWHAQALRGMRLPRNIYLMS